MSALGPDDDSDLLAGELALGLFDGTERATAERRALSDPDFARRVEAWRMRLAAFADSVPPEPAPGEVWSRIVRRLEADADGVVVRLRRRVALWRGTSAAAAAVAAALLAALVWPRPPAPAPLLTARLTGAEGPTVFVALFDPARGRLVLTPATVAARGGRAPELWLIPKGGKPVALGVAAFERAVQISPPVAPSGTGAILAVSIEPLGGSPTGQPTGPVVATGKLESIQAS